MDPSLLKNFSLMFAKRQHKLSYCASRSFLLFGRLGLLWKLFCKPSAVEGVFDERKFEGEFAIWNEWRCRLLAISPGMSLLILEDVSPFFPVLWTS